MPECKTDGGASKPDSGSNISFKNIIANNNGGNGVTIGYGVTGISFGRLQANGNGGDGVEIQGPEKVAVLRSLHELSEELAKTDNTDSLRVLVAECEQEAKRPDTNKARITSLMESVKSLSASAVEFVPKIATAIDSVMTTFNSLRGTQP